jgi:hypothetical protein
MTDDTPGAADQRAQTILRMHAIASGLQASGLDTRVYENQGVVDIRATLYNGGGKGTDVIVDEDGYVNLTYWNDRGATPTQFIDVINRALAAITG